MPRRIAVLVIILIGFIVPPLSFDLRSAEAIVLKDIRLDMYVVKAIGAGGKQEFGIGLNKIKTDLKSTHYSKFSLIKCEGITLPAKATGTYGLAKGYSIKVTPSGSRKRVSIEIVFCRGTKSFSSMRNSATRKRNAMFELRDVYKRGALLVIFTLR